MDTHNDDPQHPHIHRPVPRRAFEPQILHDAADSPTHSYSFAPAAHSPTSADLHSSRSSDFLAQLNARLLRTYHAREDAPESPVDGVGGSTARLPRQNKSFLNMNSSTLFGIYDDVGAGAHGAASVADTPWGTGAETPGHTAMGWRGGVYEGAAEGGLSMAAGQRGGNGVKRRKPREGSHRSVSGIAGQRQTEHHHRRGSHLASRHRTRRSSSTRYVVLAAKLVALFTFGVLYGTIVSHLHDTRQLAAVHVVGLDRKSWFYVSSWGCAGVALGSLLPYVDLQWRRHSRLSETQSRAASAVQDGACDGVDDDADTDTDTDMEPDAEVPVSEQINDVVRSVAAFVGVAFAIRRLPWQSTLQLTLTLALVNPALWYILDRSKPGLSLSLLVTSLLTSLMFLSNPVAWPMQGGVVVGGAGNGTAGGHAGSAGGNAGNTGNGGGGGGGPPGNAVNPTQDVLFAGLVTYESLAVVTWVGSVLFCSCVCFGSIGRRLGVWEK